MFLNTNVVGRKLPFDPTILPVEEEAQTRQRHNTFEWKPDLQRSVSHGNYELDSAFAGYVANAGKRDIFTSSYEEAPVHVTMLDEGVLIGRQFLVVDRQKPTLSSARLNFIQLSRISEKSGDMRQLMVPEGPVYLVGANNVFNNHYHWMYQCLPCIALLRQVALERGLDYRIVLPPLDARHRRSLELLGVASSECITLDSQRFIADVALMYSSAMSGRFMFQPSAKLMGLLDPFRDVCLSSVSTEFPKKIYVSRRDSKKRRLVNEEKLIDWLALMGFQEMQMSALTLEEQTAAFSNAEFIVAPHGAALVNLMFANSGTKLVEIMPELYRCAHFFRLAQCRSLRYVEVRADSVGGSADNAREAGLLHINIDKVRRAIERLQC